MDELEATGQSEIEAIRMVTGISISYVEWLRDISPDYDLFYAKYGIPPRAVTQIRSAYGQILLTRLEKCMPCAGVAQLLRTIKSRGITVAVVTNQLREVVQLSCQMHNLGQYVDLFVYGDELLERKPSCEPLAYALRKLHLRPTQTVYMDDMRDGVRIGLEVGTITIGVNSLLPQRLELADATLQCAADILSLLDGRVFKMKMHRRVYMATPSAKHAIESRYIAKARGRIARTECFSHADNIAFAWQIMSWNVLSAGLRLIDVGCGCSVYSLILGVQRSLTVIRCDISRVALYWSISWHGSYLTRAKAIAVRGDSAELSVLKDSCDLAIMSEVLEHVPDDRVALKEVIRVLKTDGWIVVSVPNAMNNTMLLFRHLQAQFNLAGHVREYTPMTMKILLESLGLEVCDSRCSSFFVYWAIFSLERSRFGSNISKWCLKHPRAAHLMRYVLGAAIYTENKVLGAWANWGMCRVFLLRRATRFKEDTR